MTRDEVTGIVKELLMGEFAMSSELVQPGATLRGTLGMHSIQLVSLAVLLEERFPWARASGADFDQYVSLETVADVVEFVVSRMPPAGGQEPA